MNNNLKVKQLKNVIAPGTLVPITAGVPVGNKIGIWAENQLESLGFPINRKKGPDLPGHEIKTRRMGTTSAMTLGNMTTEEIISTSWEDSTIRRKCERINLTNWDESRGETVNNETIDLTGEACQTALKDSYEKIRQAIANGEDVYTKNTGDVYAEHKSGNTWQIRVSAGGLNKMKSRAWSEPILNNKELFPDA